MKNPNISRMLKYYRKLNHLSVQDVSNYLSEQGNPAAVKTIYGWESGQTQPDADTLMHLCKLYRIDNILAAFGYIPKPSDPPILLSTHEKALIRSYRTHENFQDAIDKLLDI